MVSSPSSLQMCCVDITSFTKDCPISRQLKDMISCTHNQVAPLLDKFLNTDDTIPSDKNQQEIKEALRKLYFELVTGDVDQVFSSEDEETKTECLEIKTRVLEKRFEKFHPVELDLYFKYGTVVLGGEDNAYFLKEIKDIQEGDVKKEVRSGW
jgi:hypothetical protein